MKTIKAKDFKVRAILDHFCKDLPNPSQHVISGSREELKRLRLSRNTTVYGIKVKMTGKQFKEQAKDVRKVERGRQTHFGIAGQRVQRNPNIIKKKIIKKKKK